MLLIKRNNSPVQAFSTTVRYDEYMTFFVTAVVENTRRARCTTIAYYNTVCNIFFPGDAYATSLWIFTEWLADG